MQTAAPLQASHWFHSPGAILLELGPLTIRWYGLTTALGFLAALYIMHKLASHHCERSDEAIDAKRHPERSEGPPCRHDEIATTAARLAMTKEQGHCERSDRHCEERSDEAIQAMDRHAATQLAMTSNDDLDNFALVALATGIIGARLWFVILNASYYASHPAEIVQIWLGGQSIQGGLMGGLLGTWLYDKVINKRNDYLYKLSLLATVLPLAQAIGRWGNFFNEEAYGTITTLPWGLYISHTGQLHHPTFLYESLANLLVFWILLKLRNKLESLQIIGAYLALYSSVRIVLEAMRTDSLMLAGMPAATLLSYIGLLLGLGLIIARAQSNNAAGQKH